MASLNILSVSSFRRASTGPGRAECGGESGNELRTKPFVRLLQLGVANVVIIMTECEPLPACQRACRFGAVDDVNLTGAVLRLV